MKTGSIKKMIAGLVFSTAAFLHAFAQSSITIDKVAQRWPWNNKIDITYTVSGGQNVEAGVYAKIVFTASIAGKEYVIDGMSDVVADASDGTRTVSYMLPAGLKAKGCTMSAKIIATEAPSGDDYMIVDLSNGKVTWEGLMITSDDSYNRYLNDAYKTDKLVLRKIPAGDYYAAGGIRHLDTSFYAGIFPVTSAQYAKLCGGTGDSKPKASVSWFGVRGDGLKPEDKVPAVNSNTGTFFQRLNYLTGRYFDLPTAMMSEIVIRGGSVNTIYPWGDEMNTEYIVCKENSGGGKVAVGSRLPNNYGIFDSLGNVWEMCLDGLGEGASDIFIPNSVRNGDLGDARKNKGGGSYSDSSSGKWMYFTPGSYGVVNQSPSDSAAWTGFRVYYIAR